MHFYSHSLSLFRGNCILVGSLGQPLEDIATLSLYIAGYAVHRMATSSDGAFHDQLRSLFRLAGLERKQVALLITVRAIFYCIQTVHLKHMHYRDNNHLLVVFSMHMCS